jgi:hypothetical protein
MGGNVSIVNVRVDITYFVANQDISIQGVALSQDGESNVAASRTGETWRARRIVPEEDLANVVLADLEDRSDYLWRAMHARWRDTKSVR